MMEPTATHRLAGQYMGGGLTALAVAFALQLAGASSAFAAGSAPEGDDLREVGRVLTSRGEVVARQPDDDPRPLGRGDHVYEGDTLLTGEKGRAQVRFIDQGLVQIQPGSEFLIEHYREEESDRGAFTRLVEGGLRAVSGSIGQEDRDNYRLDTPVASIGIRGTHYAVNHCTTGCAADMLGSVGGVLDGRIAVGNAGGEQEFGRNEFFAVRDANTPPEHLPEPPPGLLDATGADEGDDGDGEDPAEDGAGFTDDSDDEGEGEGNELNTHDDTLMDMTTGSDYRATNDIQSVESALALANKPYLGQFMAFDYTGETEDGSTVTYHSSIDADLSGTYPELHAVRMEYSVDGQDYSWVTSGHSDASPRDVGGVSEFGIGWGRWAEGEYSHTLNGDAYSSTGDWYYVMVDSLDRLTDMGSTGLRGEHTFSWGGGVASKNVSGFDLTADFSSMEWVSGTASFGAGDWSYSADLSGQALSQFFSLVLKDTDTTHLSVNGAFYGDSADGAMITFQDIDDGISGAGVLERQ